MRKIFEQRFSSVADALTYIKEANWDYKGRKGLFSKYDRYEGSCFYQNFGLDAQEYETRYTLKLFPDGYVTLHVIKDTSGSRQYGSGRLPDLVWHSQRDREFKRKMTDKVNSVLRAEESGLSVGFMNHPKEFPLYRRGQDDPIATLHHPLRAIDCDPDRQKLSKRAEGILYKALGGH